MNSKARTEQRAEFVRKHKAEIQTILEIKGPQRAITFASYDVMEKYKDAVEKFVKEHARIELDYSANTDAFTIWYALRRNYNKLFNTAY